ncbi:MAG TPA: exonuclease SbcCD subunit D [Acidimicrobiales bacterium]|nr:exonuclease SbcCD subunit D [Acidimicrobiales bacterium]
MKIIHTSDWHLGRSFGPISLRGDQEAFCDWFVELVRDEAADLVVIAGDLYDRAIAPIESIALFRDTAGRLLADGTVVAAITGNHDGADRVAPYAELLDLSRFYLRGGYDRVGSVITHAFADGPLDIVLLPYLDPRAAPDEFGEPAGTGNEPDQAVPAGSTGDGVQAVPAGSTGDGAQALVARRHTRTHQSVLETAAATARASCRSPRSIAVAHAFVTGGTESESERALVVGGTGAVDASVFDGFSAVALGHLHRPQRIGSNDRLAYSGTPLAYSFSEDHPKSVRIIDLDADGEMSVRTEPVPAGRPVRTIEGSITTLLDPRAHPDAHGAFVRAIVTDRETVLDAKSRLAATYPMIAEIQLRPDGLLPETLAASVSTASRRRAPIDAVHDFWEAVEGAAPDGAVDTLLVDATTRASEAVVA